MNDFALMLKYVKKCYNNFFNKIKLTSKKDITFTEVLMKPDGAKYLDSVFLGKNKVYGYNATLYKIHRDNDTYYYASYIYKKQYTQVILTDDWEKMKVHYRTIYNNNQSIIIDVESMGEGGIKNVQKTKYGRKRL